MGWSALALGALCLVGAWVLVGWAPPPRSHAQAVMRVLQHHHVAAAQVDIEQLWPSALPFYAYGAQAMPYQARIAVTLVSGRTESGVLTCLHAPHDCMMTIPGLALFGQRIPDVQPGTEWYTMLVEWLQQRLSLPLVSLYYL